jgi:hypothetical protein
MMDDDELGAVCGKRIDKGNLNIRRKPTPVCLCAPPIAHELTEARNRIAAVGASD